MSIFSPEIYLNSSDKELLRLLGEILLESENDHDFKNSSYNALPISDSDAIKLMSLLEDFLESRKFQEGSYFIESLVSHKIDHKGAKEIYLSWRTRYGKTRAVATVQWENFLARLGISPQQKNDLVWYRPSASPMKLSHFIKMEEKLADAAELHPKVKRIILDFVRVRMGELQLIRENNRTISPGSIISPIKTVIDQIKLGRSKILGHDPIPAPRIAAAMTIVLDCSTLFTTRDWSVTGFISTVAGAIPQATLPK